MQPPDLRLVETPSSPIKPYSETLASKGDLAKAIGSVITEVRELYQRDMSAGTKPGEYEAKRAQKRRTMAAMIFREFHLIDEAVKTEAGRPTETPGTDEASAQEPETPFEKAYREAEKTASSGEIPKAELIDLVDSYYDHPVITTTSRLQMMHKTGPLADDAVMVMRASALLIQTVQPPPSEQ